MPVMPVSAVAGRRCNVVRAAAKGDFGFDSTTEAPQSIVQYDNGDQAVVLTGDIKTARPPQEGETPGARMAREETEAGIINQPGREQLKPAGGVGAENTGDSVTLEKVEPPRDKDGLRTDGPTLEEFRRAGYAASAYPPAGYSDKRTDDEKAAAEKTG